MGEKDKTGFSKPPPPIKPSLMAPIVRSIRSNLKTALAIAGGAVIASVPTFFPEYWSYLKGLFDSECSIEVHEDCGRQIEWCLAIENNADSPYKGCRVYCEELLLFYNDAVQYSTVDSLVYTLEKNKGNSANSCYQELHYKLDTLLCSRAIEADSCFLYQEYLNYFGESGSLYYGTKGRCVDDFEELIKHEMEMARQAIIKDSCHIYQDYNTIFGKKGCYFEEFRTRVINNDCKVPSSGKDTIADSITCKIAREEDTCDAYHNYLIKFPSGRCSEEFLGILLDCPGRDLCLSALRAGSCQQYQSYLDAFPDGSCAAAFRDTICQSCQPDVKADYYDAVQKVSCAAYQDFLDKYESKTDCFVEEIKALYMQQNCTDSLACARAKRLDTENAYKAYLRKFPKGVCAREFRKLVEPDCKSIQNIHVIKIGPLFWTTENTKGPHGLNDRSGAGTKLVNWVQAFKACARLGQDFRVPCEREARYITGNSRNIVKEPNFYSLGNAYPLLTDPADCGFKAKMRGYSKSGNAIENRRDKAYFWAATEYSDTEAWAYVFDKGNNTIEMVPMNKDSYLSCRCVQEIPDLIEKSWLGRVDCVNRPK